MLIGAHGFSDKGFLVDANGGSILKISLKDLLMMTDSSYYSP